MHTILVDINNVSTTHVILDESSEILTKGNNVNQRSKFKLKFPT